MDSNFPLLSKFVPGFALAAVMAAAGSAFAQTPAATPNAQPSEETQAPATNEPAQPAAEGYKGAHDESADTKALQLALNKQGADLKADGVMGRKTRAALRDYQRKNNLKPTGTLDEETETKLGIK